MIGYRVFAGLCWTSGDADEGPLKVKLISGSIVRLQSDADVGPLKVKLISGSIVRLQSDADEGPLKVKLISGSIVRLQSDADEGTLKTGLCWTSTYLFHLGQDTHHYVIIYWEILLNSSMSKKFRALSLMSVC